MKKDWQTRNLGELCRIRTGKKDVNQGNPEGEFPFFTCAAKPTYSDSYSFDAEALLIAGNGDVGKVSYYKGKFEAYQRTYVLTEFSEVLPRFLFLVLDGKLKETVSKQKLGNTMPYIKVGMLNDFQVPIPPLPEQKRIIGILDEAFEGIATATANAEKNLQNACALFESHIHSVFTQRHKDWIEKPLGEVCEYLNGKAHEQCIDKDGRFIVINSKFISSEGAVFKKSNEALLLLQPGDIAMVLSDVPNGKALAKCFLVEEANTYTLNQRICLIRSKKFHTKFLFYQLNRNKHFLAFDNGENQTNMRLNQILECPLFLPSITEQENIAARLDDLREETQHLEFIYQQKLDALEALKKSLLNQAFTGEL
jgi:type I restriction enzyme S subunit